MLRVAPFRLLFLLLVTNAQSLTNRNTQANLYEEQISALPDIEYEQVIAERYLFASFANESTIWPILTNIKYAWQAISLPGYHSQASKGVWLLSEVINEDKAMTSSFGQYQMSWMLLSANATLVVLSEINVNNNNSFLVSSHNPITSSSYSAALITPNSVQLILCDISNATSCRVVQTIYFPSVLDNITKINDGLFVED
ncbi:unnamed protein product, partial [Rotaria socialis]